MTTPPLSACSSTTTLVPISIPTVLIPSNIPEVPEIPMAPSSVETLNETVVSDHRSDSDESLQIIDKNSVVRSDDLPTGLELEKRVRNDWKSRRGIDFPGPSSSDPSQKQGDSIDMDRPCIPGRLIIDSNASVTEDKLSPKRRFLSLSPLRTILSPRLMTDPVRPMSAQPSPSSSPYATSSRNIFFRSSTNLAASSTMKLPLFPSKNENSISRKLFGKGKEKLDKGKEKLDEEKEKLDAWEVVDEDNYPEESVGGYTSSLMSAVQSLNLSPSSNSPARSQSFSVGVRSSASAPARTNQIPNGSNMAMVVPVGADSPPARPISPVTHPRASPTPTPLILKHTALPIYPSPLRPTIMTEDQAFSSIIYQQALDTPLPATPVNDREIPAAKAIISARSVSDPLNNLVSAGDVSPPSLSLHCLAQINSTEELMTPSRHHYTGRPLPRPPPSVTRSNIDSTFAPEVSADTESLSSTRCPEGLLIDLDDTSLDSSSASGASTPLSDGARLRSRLHLTITPSSSTTELTMESGSQRSAPMIRGRSSPISDISGLTELDLLVSRLADGEDDSSDYEVSPGHPGWLPSSLNNSPDTASGFRVNWTGKPDPCPYSVPPAIYQRQRQHLTHWEN